MEATEIPLSVLLVDDEPALTASMKVGLRKSGWKIATADSGEEALEMSRANHYDVIVSDERMPGMQGSDLLTLVRTESPDTLRITLSGQASVARTIHAINSAEIHRFLVKPCPPLELKTTIEELLEKKSRQDVVTDATRTIESSDEDSLTDLLDKAMGVMWMSFQPIINCDGEEYGFEALVRTDLDEIKHPGHLFEIAETLGRSCELGATIRDLVAGKIAAAPEGATIFVNVNPDHLLDESLYSASSPLSKYASRVVIEVTERSSIGTKVNLAECLDRLFDLGFRVAVDDLGAGYSGLNTFSQLSPSIVKFDMELIRNIDRSPTKQAVIMAMTQLCESLGIRTIAEGVETEGEYLTAKWLGCDYFQGYYLGRPMKGFSDLEDRQAA